MTDHRLADIGVIGLAVMGENLVLNMESKGFTVACFNRTADKVRAFAEGRAKGRRVIGCVTLPDFVQALARPRKIMMMVKAGTAVDDLIEQLLPLTEPGDILIDGGNTWHEDTARRLKHVGEKGLLYVGTGVSGGEEGALRGPSLMPGGSPEAWPLIRPVFQAIAAHASDGLPCCDWMGPGGAGHFVKMVHNGIEYGDMQLIAEVYSFMKNGLRLPEEAMSNIFRHWNQGELNSYLIEITADILSTREPGGQHTLDLILDAAAQKGTGRWTVEAALLHGQPLTLIAEAVLARSLSAMKDERVAAAAILPGPKAPAQTSDPLPWIEALHAALYASKIVSYAQGFELLRTASVAHSWGLDFGSIAQIWRGGCVIRSVFLDRIREACQADAALSNIMLARFFSDALASAQNGWRKTVAAAAQWGLPTPALSSALSYYDGYRSARLPANLIQAQRDYFGAHLYERTDRPRGEYFHTNWTGQGGSTLSGAYSA